MWMSSIHTSFLSSTITKTLTCNLTLPSVSTDAHCQLTLSLTQSLFLTIELLTHLGLNSSLSPTTFISTNVIQSSCSRQMSTTTDLSSIFCPCLTYIFLSLFVIVIFVLLWTISLSGFILFVSRLLLLALIIFILIFIIWYIIDVMFCIANAFMLLIVFSVSFVQFISVIIFVITSIFIFRSFISIVIMLLFSVAYFLQSFYFVDPFLSFFTSH